jgi:Xaa-Pro aminopeptidase
MAVVRGAGARPSFPFVVGAGRNAAIPHYFANDAPMPADGLVVIDAGAAYRRYAADITRTFPISGKFTAEQGRVYDAVLEAQLAGIAAVRPGASFRDIHKAARDTLDKHGLAEYFIHGTSHHVGLDAHDPGPTRPLRPGMTLTVEPGVYILDKRIGVRIEDIVLVTETGCEVLSRGLPKKRDDIERLLAALARPAAGG